MPQLHFVYGPMFAGKTSTLIRVTRRIPDNWTIVTPSVNTRDGSALTAHSRVITLPCSGRQLRLVGHVDDEETDTGFLDCLQHLPEDGECTPPARTSTSTNSLDSKTNAVNTKKRKCNVNASSGANLFCEATPCRNSQDRSNATCNVPSPENKELLVCEKYASLRELRQAIAERNLEEQQMLEQVSGQRAEMTEKDSIEGSACDVERRRPVRILLIDEIHLFKDWKTELLKFKDDGALPGVNHVVVVGLQLGFQSILPPARMLVTDPDVKCLRVESDCVHCLEETLDMTDQSIPIVGSTPALKAIITLPKYNFSFNDVVGGAEKYCSICKNHYTSYRNGSLDGIDYKSWDTPCLDAPIEVRDHTATIQEWEMLEESLEHEGRMHRGWQDLLHTLMK